MPLSTTTLTTHSNVPPPLEPCTLRPEGFSMDFESYTCGSSYSWTESALIAGQHFIQAHQQLADCPADDFQATVEATHSALRVSAKNSQNNLESRCLSGNSYTTRGHHAAVL